GFAQMIGNALIEDRESMARADAWRSVIFILLATGLLWLWVKDKLKVNTAVIVLATLILIDMWVVNRRYLNKDNFVEESSIAAQFPEREVDQLIGRDPAQNYRVLDLSIPTFNSAKIGRA